MALRKLATSSLPATVASSVARPTCVQGVRTYRMQASSSTDLCNAENRAAGLKINQAFALEAPFASLAARVGDFAEPFMNELQAAKKAGKPDPKDIQLYVPEIPHLLPVARWAKDNQVLRQVLVHDHEKEPTKPRMTWYHPDDTMVPRGWFSEGLMGDMHYYFGDVEGLPVDLSKLK